MSEGTPNKRALEEITAHSGVCKAFNTAVTWKS